MTDKTLEPQYQYCVDLKKNKGLTKLGVMTNQDWHDDPKHLLFTLSRYKFVAKMLSGKKKALEIGCGDAFATKIVLQEVEALTAIDFDPLLIADVQERMDPDWPFTCMAHDITHAPLPYRYDAAYSIDVLEHIPQQKEQQFIHNIVSSLAAHGIFLVGTPSLASQAFATDISRQGHVNCKSHLDLKAFLAPYFHHVFLFSMNDEVVHTGYYKMAHYLWALCVEPRR